VYSSLLKPGIFNSSSSLLLAAYADLRPLFFFDVGPLGLNGFGSSFLALVGNEQSILACLMADAKLA
jgi:hypothetical protein